jgi:hypothetical protein
MKILLKFTRSKQGVAESGYTIEDGGASKACYTKQAFSCYMHTEVESVDSYVTDEHRPILEAIAYPIYVHKSTVYHRMWVCSDSKGGLSIPGSLATSKEQSVYQAIKRILGVGIEKYNSLTANLLPIPEGEYETFEFKTEKEESVNEIVKRYDIPNLRDEINNIIDDEGHLIENPEKLKGVSLAVWCALNLGDRAKAASLLMQMSPKERDIALAIAEIEPIEGIHRQ